MMTNKEIRSTGREYLRGNYKSAIINLILLGVANSTLQSIVRSLTGESAMNIDLGGQTLPTWDTIFSLDFSTFQTSLNVVLSLVVGLVIAAMQMGNDWGYLDMVDGVPLSAKHLFKPFEKNVWKTFGLLALQAILIFLWAILFVIPGIIKFYSLALANYIYFDSADMKITDIMRQSESYMKGKKWNLFKLDMSYVWIYLVPIVLFLGYLVSFVISVYGAYDSNTASSDALLGQLFLFIILMGLTLVVFGILTFVIEPRRKAARAVFYTDVLEYENSASAGENDISIKE